MSIFELTNKISEALVLHCKKLEECTNKSYSLKIGTIQGESRRLPVYCAVNHHSKNNLYRDDELYDNIVITFDKYDEIIFKDDLYEEFKEFKENIEQENNVRAKKLEFILTGLEKLY